MSSILGPGKVRVDSTEPINVAVTNTPTQGGAIAYGRLTNLDTATRLPESSSPVVWSTESLYVEVEPGKVTRADPPGSNWAGAYGAETLIGDGRLSGVANAGARAVLALHAGPLPGNAISLLGWAMEHDVPNNQARVLTEGGAINTGPWISASQGTPIGIGVQNGVVTYFVGGAVIHTSSVPPESDLGPAAYPEGGVVGGGFTDTVLEGAWSGGAAGPTVSWARVFVEAGEVRFRDDGGIASPNFGAPWGEGSFFETYAPHAASIIETIPGSVVTVELY